MEPWPAERVAALAPDPASRVAGQALAHAEKWEGLGRSDRAIWGLCHGSARQPYQARVDLSEPAFKCSCPSRKFPCKHGLGLLFLFAKTADAFWRGAEPGWVAEWIDARSEPATRKVEPPKRPSDKRVDVEAQARRVAQRESRVRDGVEGCRMWLDDLVRRGLAAAQGDPAADWERAAARLVDAQAPGLASFVRRIPMMMASGPGWETRTIDLLGRLHLLLCAAERLADLPPDLAGDVRTALGWQQSREDALTSPAVADRWTAVGQVIEEDERFRVARTWLLGQNTGRRALILDFAAGMQPLEPSIVAGSAFDGELAFYPSVQPLRALLKSRSVPMTVDHRFRQRCDASIEAGLLGYAGALASNPWTYRWPLVLDRVRLVAEGAGWFLVDEQNHGMPVRPAFARTLQLWRLVSAGEGSPMTVMTEWDGLSALPIGAFNESSNEYLDLAPRWFA
jgi:SWIM zinc finger